MKTFEGTEFESFADAVGRVIGTLVQQRPETLEAMDAALETLAEEIEASSAADRGLVAEAVQMIRGGVNSIPD